ncbi:putative Translationally-controlled tumor protein like protein [Fusarium oxysporum f. sp. albedinis]|nr:putative Translationally-controlled tumor protein like protein [Fusarium oxysporum f. sp. albedinis]
MAIQGCAAKLPTRSKTRSGQLETDCRNLRRTVSHIPSARRSTSAELHHIDCCNNDTTLEQRVIKRQPR